MRNTIGHKQASCRSNRIFLLLSRQLAFALVCLSILSYPSFAFGHPGHDHHAPQTGLLHWLLAPVHAIPLLAGFSLLAAFLVWKLRAVLRRA